MFGTYVLGLVKLSNRVFDQVASHVVINGDMVVVPLVVEAKLPVRGNSVHLQVVYVRKRGFKLRLRTYKTS